MLQSPFSWREDAGRGEETSNSSWGADYGSRTMRIRLSYSDLATAIPYIVGYSTVVGDRDVHGVSDGLFNINQRQLFRKTPAQHPFFPNMYATKIVSIQGQGPQPGPGNVAPPPPPAIQRIYGNWKQAVVEIMFELPKFPILQDNQILLKEYNRYTSKLYVMNMEVLDKKSPGNWRYTERIAAAVSPLGFGGNIYVKNPKGILEWTWYDVHEDWILLGKLNPSNFIHALGTLNDAPFPAIAAPNQNQPGVFFDDSVQYPAGTLLFLPWETTLRTQCPNPLNANIPGVGPQFQFPRTYDVKLRWLHFDPPLGPSFNSRLVRSLELDGITRLRGGWSFIQMNVGTPPVSVLVRVQGHNLAPLPRQDANGFTWHPVSRGTVLVPQNVSPLTMNNLIYTYTDHEQIFNFAVGWQ